MRAQGQARLDLLVLASSLLLFVVVSRSPQGIYSDPAWQLKAVQQAVAGESSSPNRLVQASTADLSKDDPQWIFFWAPGPVLLTYPLVRLGLPVGHAVRTVAAVALAVGAVGWPRWFRRFELPASMTVAFALVLPWIHYASHALALFSAEILVFASAPWLLLMTVALAERLGRRDSAAETASAWLVGLGLGFAYWLKYSTALVAVGGLVFLYVHSWRHTPRRGDVARRLAAATIGVAMPVLFLNAVNVWLGQGANPIAAESGFRIRWEPLLALVGNPALAAVDAESLWNFVLLHPITGVTTSHAWVSVIGLPGGLAMAWLLVRNWERSTSHTLATLMLGTSGAALVCIWMFSAVSLEARHLAAASLAALPAVVEGGCRVFRSGRRTMRVAMVALGMFYVAGPVGYGVASVAASVQRTSGYQVGTAAIYNPLLADRDVQTVSASILTETRGREDVWYLADPLTALDLPGRAIVRHADFMPIAQLRETFLTSSPIRIRALLPATFEGNGKGAAIRGSFVHAARWTSRVVDGSPYLLWTADIAPS